MTTPHTPNAASFFLSTICRVVILCWATAGIAIGAPSTDRVDTTELYANLVETVASSVVTVEYTLQLDGTEEPRSRGWNERCPNCGNFHSDRVDPMLRQERPVERPGFVISPTEVVTGHLLVNPRFIKSVEVRHNGRTVSASPGAYSVGQNAVMLVLDEPLDNLEPIEFGADENDALYLVSVSQSRGRLSFVASPFSGSIIMRDGEAPMLTSNGNSVIVDVSGKAAAISMSEELPRNGAWTQLLQGDDRIDASRMETLMEGQKDVVEELFPRVSLRFRSPRETADPYAQYSVSRSNQESDTEREAIGVLLPDGLLMVQANLSAATTARLEWIRVHLAGHSEPVEASFEASLRDHGAFLARLEEPVAGVVLSATPMDSLPGRLLLGTDLRVRGDYLEAQHEPLRIVDVRKGHRGALFPEIAGNSDDLFLFALDGSLVALPMIQRERTVEERPRWRSDRVTLTPVSVLAEVFADVDAHVDLANVPLDESEEGRLAWVGVELQPMDRGLARDLGVSAQTDNGEVGALVTHVYVDSPAAEAGIQSGDVILHLSAEGLPRQYPIKLEQDRRRGEPFPWEYLDQIPDEFYVRLPLPWNSQENAFSRFVTELGRGIEVRIAAVRDEEEVDFTLTPHFGIAHYETAPQHRSDVFGFTVREFTYETRLFYRRGDDAPGVIIARIEPGSAASGAGLKPYELITHVNDVPVTGIESFEDAIKDQQELRLNVQRMHQGRIAVVRRR